MLLLKAAAISIPLAVAVLAFYMKCKGRLRQSAYAEKAYADMRNLIMKEEEQSTITFYFLKAEYVRQCTCVALPCFQTLLADGLLTKRCVSRTDAYCGELAGEYVVVSHRWLHPAQPDKDGVQLRELKTFLAAHPKMRWVWIECAEPRSHRVASHFPHT